MLAVEVLVADVAVLLIESVLSLVVSVLSALACCWLQMSLLLELSRMLKQE
jgi:hypothetical protein